MHKIAQCSSFSQETLTVQNSNTNSGILCIIKGVLGIMSMIWVSITITKGHWDVNWLISDVRSYPPSYPPAFI